MQVDQILHHVLDSFRARVHDVHFEGGPLHAARSELIELAVVRNALRCQEVRVGDLVVGRRHQTFDICRFIQPRVIVTDQFGTKIARPVEQLLAFDRDQVHAVATP